MKPSLYNIVVLLAASCALGYILSGDRNQPQIPVATVARAAEPETEPKMPGRQNLTLEFNNVNDPPNTRPYMLMRLNSLPDKSLPMVISLKEEIEDEVGKSGGVFRPDDYVNLEAIVIPYAQRFRESGAKFILVDYTMVNKRFSLHGE